VKSTLRKEIDHSGTLKTKDKLHIHPGYVGRHQGSCLRLSQVMPLRRIDYCPHRVGLEIGRQSSFTSREHKNTAYIKIFNCSLSSLRQPCLLWTSLLLHTHRNRIFDTLLARMLAMSTRFRCPSDEEFHCTPYRHPLDTATSERGIYKRKAPPRDSIRPHEFFFFINQI